MSVGSSGKFVLQVVGEFIAFLEKKELAIIAF
jgi:hypothetical protein